MILPGPPVPNSISFFNGICRTCEICARPELRIVDADLWQQVKDRQSALEIEPKTKPSGKPLIDRRRARYLFSGLINCGCCGGGFSMISQTRLGCSTARNKNTCDNRLTIKREVVEQRILTALRERLMEPALFAEFCQEFTKEMNRLRMDASASLAGKRAELARIERQLQKLLEALLDDGDSKTIVKNMQALEARPEALEAELSQADSPPPLLHPNMSEVYHRKINELHQALTSDDTKTEAAEILRTLIDAITLTPEDSELSLYLKGDLAGILTLAQNKTKALANVAKGSGGLAHWLRWQGRWDSNPRMPGSKPGALTTWPHPTMHRKHRSQVKI